MLYQLHSSSYPDCIALADSNDCGCVYPLSVAEGIQDGDIFTNSEQNYTSVLFWTHNGFAYHAGNVDACFLEDVYSLIADKDSSNNRRFLLMNRDLSIEAFFLPKKMCSSKKDIYLHMPETQTLQSQSYLKAIYARK